MCVCVCVCVWVGGVCVVCVCVCGVCVVCVCVHRMLEELRYRYFIAGEGWRPRTNGG